MVRPSRQEHRRRQRTWFTFLFVLALIGWPLSPSQVSLDGDALNPVATSSIDLEDDFEVEPDVFTLHEEFVREAPPAIDSLISFVWPERPYRPPIT